MNCYTYITGLGIETTIHYFYDHAEVCCCGHRRLKSSLSAPAPPADQ